MLLLLTSCLLLSAPTARAQAGRLVSVQPPAIVFSRPYPDEHRRTAVIRYHGQESLNVLSLLPSDPAIRAALKETIPGRMYLLRLTFPPGYLPSRDKPADIAIITDLEDAPDLHVPVAFREEPRRDSAWMARANALIGKPAPALSLESGRGSPRRDGSGRGTVGGLDESARGQELRLGGKSDKIRVLIFWWPECEHCAHQLPILQELAESYGGQQVEFLAVGSHIAGRGIVLDIAGRIGWKLPLAVDRGMIAASRYGVQAYPVIFLIDRSGVIQAAHGRWTALHLLDGLENLEDDLPVELDILLAGKTRADFPKPPAAANRHHSPATRPVSMPTAPDRQRPTRSRHPAQPPLSP
jgi:thiol-disulfide isomerase/thioredoxin